MLLLLASASASSTASASAIFVQVENEEEKVIVYSARKLTKSQSNYPTIKGEPAAMIYFMKYFRYYLQFKRFVLRTDHCALTWIKTMEHPTGMMKRWLETLSTFDFVVLHRQGKHHVNKDALRRVDHAPEMEEEEEETPLLNSSVQPERRKTKGCLSMPSPRSGRKQNYPAWLRNGRKSRKEMLGSWR